MTQMPSPVDASAEIPPLNSNVYYFPEGHLERIQSSPAAAILNYNFTLSRPFIPCPEIKTQNDVVSFSKSLTPSDANNGGGFSIPKFCAEPIFPRLQSISAARDAPAQDLTVTDAARNHAFFVGVRRRTARRIDRRSRRTAAGMEFGWPDFTIRIPQSRSTVAYRASGKATTVATSQIRRKTIYS